MRLALWQVGAVAAIFVVLLFLLAGAATLACCGCSSLPLGLWGAHTWAMHRQAMGRQSTQAATTSPSTAPGTSPAGRTLSLADMLVAEGMAPESITMAALQMGTTATSAREWLDHYRQACMGPLQPSEPRLSIADRRMGEGPQ